MTNLRPISITEWFDLSACSPKQIAAIRRRCRPQIAEARRRHSNTQYAVDSFARRNNHLFGYHMVAAVKNDGAVHSALYWEKDARQQLRQAVTKCLIRYGVAAPPL